MIIGSSLFSISLGIIIQKYFIANQRSVLGTTREINVIPLQKMQKNESGNLKFYYEPPINTTTTNEADWLPYVATYKHNEDGLNDLTNYTLEKPSNAVRILTLGDSFVYGMFVNTEDNFSELLEQELNSQQICPQETKFEILNFGVGGYDIEYSVERFIKKGLKYNPDLVLWYIRDDDFFLINEQFLERALYFEKRLETKEPSALNSEDIKIKATNLTYKEFYDKNNTFRSSEERRVYIEPEMASVPRLVESYNGPLVIFTFSDTPEEYKGYIHELIQNNQNGNIRYFDVFPDIETFHPYDYHPTAKGHKTIADSLHQFLLNFSLLPCKK
jgi:hypothetical protein